MKSICIIILICFLLALAPHVYAQADQHYEYKSPQKAQKLSLFWTLGLVSGGTLLAATGEDAAIGFGSVLVWSGILFTPGLGHLYAHHSWPFWRGVMIRHLGTGLIFVAMAISWDDPDVSGGWELFIGGSAVVIGSAVYDIVTAKKSAREYNARYGLEDLSIAPAYFPESNAVGLSLSLKF